MYVAWITYMQSKLDQTEILICQVLGPIFCPGKNPFLEKKNWGGGGPTFMIFYIMNQVYSAKADPARPPLFEILKSLFWKVWLNNTHKLYCYQHAMFRICILFSVLTTKACEGASKQFPDLKNYTAPGPRPPPRFLYSWIRHCSACVIPCTIQIFHPSYESEI